jgi:hypothetical protein
MENQNRLFDKFNSRPGATDGQISSAENGLGIRLPHEYAEFLKNRNGGEGLIGEAYVTLWAVSELAPLNLSYESNRWAPGLLIFGSDGGGEALGFDTRAPNWPIVQIPFVGMRWGSAHLLGATFGKFIENLSAGIFCE